MEKAISFGSIEEDDDILFSLAADIYESVGDLSSAMRCINRAIVAAPDMSTYYLTKGLLFHRQAEKALQQTGYGNPSECISKSRDMFQIAEQKAEIKGDRVDRAHAYGALAVSYYFSFPQDKAKGEKFARLAANLGGDTWGNADRVLNIINEKQENLRREELKEDKNEKKYKEALKLAESDAISDLEEAISKFQSLDGFHDSSQQIRNCERKIATIIENRNEGAKHEQSRSFRQISESMYKEVIIRKAVLPISIFILIAVTVYTLHFAESMNYHGNFEDFVTQAGYKLVLAFMFFGIAYGINLDKGFDLRYKYDALLICSCVAYVIIYTILWIKHTPHGTFFDSLIGIPLVIVAILVYTAAISWLASKIDSLIK